jgi:hypothetical protein
MAATVEGQDLAMTFQPTIEVAATCLSVRRATHTGSVQGTVAQMD